MSSRESTNMYTLEVLFNILCAVHCPGLKTLYFMLKIIFLKFINLKNGPKHWDNYKYNSSPTNKINSTSI